MTMLQSFVQRRYSTLMLLLLTGGYIMLLTELLMLHHTEGIQLVGVIASGVGLLLTIVAIFASRKWRNGIAILLILLSVTGVIGAVEHYEEGAEAEAEAHLVQPTATTANLTIAYRAQATAEEGEEEAGEAEHEGEEGEEVPPPLAPLSLAGFALMGAVTTLAKRDE